MPDSRWDETLLSEKMQKEESIAWTTVTEEKWCKKMKLGFGLRHT